MKKFFIITGPSASGKGSIINSIIKRNKNRFVVSDSYSTRPKRLAEGTIKKYIFIDQNTFEKYAEQGKMLEYKQEHLWWYGTSKQSFDRALTSTKQLILELEPRGALDVVSKYPDHAVLIFINPGSIAELKSRILSDERRKNMTDKELKVRLDFAKKEFGYKDKAKYIIINKKNQLEDAVDKLSEIIEQEAGIALD